MWLPRRLERSRSEPTGRATARRIAICAGVVAVSTVSTRMSVYVNSAGFTVRYPSSWQSVEYNSRTLLIIRGNTRVEGSVITRGEAAIRVFDASAGDAVYRMIIKGKVPPGTKIDSMKTVNHAQPEKAGCTRSVVVSLVDTDATLNSASRTTYFTCMAGERRVGIALSQFVADRGGDLFLRVAEDMVRSVRFKSLN